jgi:hypothetical protein
MAISKGGASTRSSRTEIDISGIEKATSKRVLSINIFFSRVSEANKASMDDEEEEEEE